LGYQAGFFMDAQYVHQKSNNSGYGREIKSEVMELEKNGTNPGSYENCFSIF